MLKTRGQACQKMHEDAQLARVSGLERRKAMISGKKWEVGQPQSADLNIQLIFVANRRSEHAAHGPSCEGLILKRKGSHPNSSMALECIARPQG